MKTLALLLVCSLLAACGGGRDGEDPPGWCDPGDQCPERETTAVLYEETADYRSVASPGVRDYLRYVMTFGSEQSAIQN